MTPALEARGPQVPDPAAMGAIEKISTLNNPYEVPPGYDELFARAMRECVLWHAKKSDFYRKVLALHGFDPAALKSLEDCLSIPAIPAQFFKMHDLLSVPPGDVVARFTSSGTTGQKSQIAFDRWSLAAGQQMVDSTFGFFGFITPASSANYLLYSYEPSADSSLGTAYTDNYLCKFAPARKIFHALRRTGAGGHEFDVFGCLKALRDYAEEGLPARIFGFPAFLYFTLGRMRDLKLKPLRLPPESLVFLGGGWKSHAEEALPKDELYALITHWLGIPAERIRDSFGAVEHPIPYSECRNHHFHVPVWSQAVIRDVATLKPLDFGRAGFLQFLTPFLTSVPAHSVLMGDLASLHPGSGCGCDIARPYFIVHGRAGTSKNKSCALAAAELLRRERA